MEKEIILTAADAVEFIIKNLISKGLDETSLVDVVEVMKAAANCRHPITFATS